MLLLSTIDPRRKPRVLGPQVASSGGRQEREIAGPVSWIRQAPYAMQVVLLAVSYWVVAKLSLAFAIPPGYATAVWPPSGVALVAILLFGNRIWPGIWLGAALVNFTVDYSSHARCR